MAILNPTYQGKSLHTWALTRENLFLGFENNKGAASAQSDKLIGRYHI